MPGGHEAPVFARAIIIRAQRDPVDQILNKRAPAEYPIADVLARRWSPRAFADRAVGETDLRTLFEAARWAPSRSNSQPWRFLVATRREPREHERLASVLSERNRRWAMQAPVLALGIAQVRVGDRPLLHGHYDVGQAVGSLLVQATELDLHVHQMAGYDRQAARELFGIPDDFEPMSALAIGYLGDLDSLPEDLRERELAARQRRSTHEFVFTGQFGSSRA